MEKCKCDDGTTTTMTKPPSRWYRIELVEIIISFGKIKLLILIFFF